MKPDPAGATSATISLREYLEAKIEGERELNRNFRDATAAEFRIYKETLLKETREARENVVAKLEVLNELRKAVETDRSLFIRGDKYDADMKGRDLKIEAAASVGLTKTESVERLLGARLDVLEKWQAMASARTMTIETSAARLDVLERWQAKVASLEGDVSTSHARLSALEEWRSKLLGIGLILGLLAGIVGAAIMRVLMGMFGK